MRRLMVIVLVLIAIVWLVIFFLPRPQPQLSTAVRAFDRPIYVQSFETLSEAEHVCGKNNISLVEDAPPTGRYVCSDAWWR